MINIFRKKRNIRVHKVYRRLSVLEPTEELDAVFNACLWSIADIKALYKKRLGMSVDTFCSLHRIVADTKAREYL